MAPLEPWEKVYLNHSANTFEDIDPNHGKLACEDCHGGVGVVEQELSDEPSKRELTEVMNTAHDTEFGFRRDPATGDDSVCESCHYELTQRNKHSMHSMAWGERYKVAIRSTGSGDYESCPVEIKEGFEGECASCHATCGECHVSRPNSVGGGFVERHRFRSPHMQDNCTACHGTRIGDDYFGNLQGNDPDVHFRKGFDCMDCHTEDFHGAGIDPNNPPRNRYEVEKLPECTDCHQGDAGANQYHTVHWQGSGSADDLSCYVCHSQPYNSCNSCHTGGEYREGYHETSPDVFEGARGYKEFPSFRIAYNPASAGGHWSPALEANADEQWILVRHIPLVKSSFDPWGWSTLANYAIEETWQYTSPHNINRWTAQTLVDTTADEPCYGSCHYTSEDDSTRHLYLTREYLEEEYPEEVEANAHLLPSNE